MRGVGPRNLKSGGWGGLGTWPLSHVCLGGMGQTGPQLRFPSRPAPPAISHFCWAWPAWVRPQVWVVVSRSFQVLTCKTRSHRPVVLPLWNAPQTLMPISSRVPLLPSAPHRPRPHPWPHPWSRPWPRPQGAAHASQRCCSPWRQRHLSVFGVRCFPLFLSLLSGWRDGEAAG